MYLFRRGGHALLGNPLHASPWLRGACGLSRLGPRLACWRRRRMRDYPRPLDMHTSAVFRTAKPTSSSDSGYYDPSWSVMQIQAPAALMGRRQPPPGYARRHGARRRPRTSASGHMRPESSALPNQSFSPGPGAYTPRLHKSGVPFDMSRPVTAVSIVQPRLQWERGDDGLLMPPASRSQCTPGRPTLVGREATLLEYMRGQARARSFDLKTRANMPPLMAESGLFDGLTAQDPERIPPMSQMSEWWHLPRGESRPRGPGFEAIDPFGPRPLSSSR